MSKDPYKYFRVEARELLEGLIQGVLLLDNGPLAADVLSRLLRFAHTLKGAARVVRQPRIAELAHQIEELLGPGEATAPEHATQLLRCLDEISELLRALGPQAAQESAQTQQPSAEEPMETVRVDIQDMDALLRDVTEAGVQVGALRRSVTAGVEIRDLAGALRAQLASHANDHDARATQSARMLSIADELRSSVDRFQRTLAADIERVDQELTEARDVAFRLRLLPARTIFPLLERAVHDAAQALGRRVQLETTGSDIRLDAGILSALRDAFLHIVRNAVAHGVEDEATRTAAGKHAVGRVRLDVARRGNRVVFKCSDDGKGIDVEAVRSAAVTRGLFTPQKAAALRRDEVLRLVFTGGLTTQGNVTELSGRGIGLDVVRETVKRLKGEVGITSVDDQGATIELVVPMSLASFPGLVVEAAGAIAAIPLDSIRRTLRVRDSDIARSSGTESILHDNQVVSFRTLDGALRRPRPAGRRRQVWSAVVVQSGDRLAAVGVDRILGTTSVVMRAVPGIVDPDPVIAGVSLDAEGNPQIVLDPAGLVETIHGGRDTQDERTTRERPPILVVDDSLTTRMLEKSILESAGWEVEIAVSAEEALVKARQRRYGLFIVDVDMPGMDGFEFVTRTRADAVLRETPAILVTSRNTPEDRRRGEEAGASAYIVKGEFDQSHLLHTIRTLVG